MSDESAHRGAVEDRAILRAAIKALADAGVELRAIIDATPDLDRTKPALIHILNELRDVYRRLQKRHEPIAGSDEQ